MLRFTQKDKIDRMIAGESITRIGDIWYGDDEMSTVTGIYHPSQKNVQQLVPIRAESAMAFSNSQPGVNIFEIQIVVNKGVFKDKIARLMATVQVTPVVPVMNREFAILTQPIEKFPHVYQAYGIDVNPMNTPVDEAVYSDKIQWAEAYCSVPVMAKIDNISINTIPKHPDDFNITITLKKVMTASYYGNKTSYVKNIDGATTQEEYIRSLSRSTGDTPQIDATAKLFGIDSDTIRNMIDEMVSPDYEEYEIIDATYIRAVYPDLIEVILDGTTIPSYVKIFGVEAYINKDYNWSNNKVSSILSSYNNELDILGSDNDVQTVDAYVKEQSNIMITSRYPIRVEMIKRNRVFFDKVSVDFGDIIVGSSRLSQCLLSRDLVLNAYYTRIGGAEYTNLKVFTENGGHPHNMHNKILYDMKREVSTKLFPGEFITDGISEFDDDESSYEETTLVRVVDGDTIVVKYKDGRIESIRILGIDTASSIKGSDEMISTIKKHRGITEDIVYAAGKAAKDYLYNILNSNPKYDTSTIFLRKDTVSVGDRDRYNRPLRHVLVRDTENEELVNVSIIMTYQGYAFLSPFSTDTKKELLESFLQARSARRGIFGLHPIWKTIDKW